jgi:CheY-like chemotaxis protein
LRARAHSIACHRDLGAHAGAGLDPQHATSNLDGLGLEIKADATLKTIPVAVLTTSNAERDVLESYGSHANCYIVKPVQFENFVRAALNIQSFWFSVVTLPSDSGT